MNRRSFVTTGIAAGVTALIPLRDLVALSSGKNWPQISDKLMDENDIIPAPDDPDHWQEWRNALHNWRKRKQSELKYDGSTYLSEPFSWVTRDFSCGFIMTCDSDFYDANTNEYRISQLIDRAKSDYGGYDSVVIWHAYPRIGLDDRNQFDFYREMPGGLAGLRATVAQFHKAGITVFIDYNPWDTGTRREKKPDIELLTEMLKGFDGDGIFLDTMKDAPGFREKLDSVRKGIVLEGEIALPLEYIQTHHMSWAQWFPDSRVPGVYRNKWFERHHMQHAIARWNSDKTDQVHTAWMNGSGILIWENVFGQLLEWNSRDKSIYRSMYSIQHHFAPLFSGEGWKPLSDVSQVQGVYISCWQGDGILLWTLVNRNEKAAEGILFSSEVKNSYSLFDLIKGEEVTGEIKNDLIQIKGRIGGRGIACFLSINKDKIDTSFTDFLAKQKKIFESASEITEFTTTNIRTLRLKGPAGKLTVPPGMKVVPAISITLSVEYRFREPGGYGNIQNHLKLATDHKLHSICRIERKADLKKFAIDETPVTNNQFKVFLNRSGYKPRIPENFLKHWKGGEIPAGKEDHPVVYVDLEDAMAYASWSGKRLPTEEEWQYAAQGRDALEYPWGNALETGRCNQNSDGTTTAVNAFPDGKSPYGCLDMCGNTWELTGNQYTDGRTRFVMLKGGSCYKPEGSDWYFDGGPQKNSFVAKMLLIWPGLDRCSTVGFRCVADLL